VPFDLDPHRTIFIQKGDFPIEDRPSIRPQVILIKIESDVLVLELLHSLLESLLPKSIRPWSRG
jgi:hypothetical protein